MIEYYQLQQAVVRLSAQSVVDPHDAELRYAVCDVVDDSLTRFCRRFEERSPTVDFVADLAVTVQASGPMSIAGEAFLFTDNCRGHSVHSFVITVYGDRHSRVADWVFEIAIDSRCRRSRGLTKTDCLERNAQDDLITERFAFFEAWAAWYEDNIGHYLNAGRTADYIVDDFIFRLCVGGIADRFLSVVRSLPDWLAPRARERVKRISDATDLLDEVQLLSIPSETIMRLKEQFALLKAICVGSL